MAVVLMAFLVVLPIPELQKTEEMEHQPEATRGDASAQYRLGEMYAYGLGVDKDEAEAVKWYRLAAEQGYWLSQHSLGEMYAKGRGVKKDDAEALKWFKLAAEQGYAPAQDKLGEIATGQSAAID